jgi:WD40 repeat protein/DNA-binding CsgD family transcriptional regulator
MNISDREPIFEPLTDRELDVLRLLTDGLPNREIAQELVITLGTVKWYNRQIYGKLGSHSREEAVAQARDAGLLGPDVPRHKRSWLYSAIGLAFILGVVATLLLSDLLSRGLQSVAKDRGQGVSSASGAGVSAPLIIQGHFRPARDVAWSPDGSKLTSASDDNTIMVWDARTGENLLMLSGHTEDVTSVEWSPDGMRLASGSRDNAVFLWDVQTGELVETLRAYSSEIRAIAWSLDGAHLASGDLDGRVVLWDPEGDEPLGTLEGHADWIHSLEWLADSRTLMSASAGGTIIFWDVKTRETLRSLELLPTYTHEFFEVISFVAALSPDGSRLAHGGFGGAALFDAATGEEIFQIDEDFTSVRSAAWSPDGLIIALGSGTGEASRWNSQTGEPMGTFDVGRFALHGLAWSPDGERLAAATDQGAVIVWEIDS